MAARRRARPGASGIGFWAVISELPEDYQGVPAVGQSSGECIDTLEFREILCVPQVWFVHSPKNHGLARDFAVQRTRMIH
jgi:hypothetical protein